MKTEDDQAEAAREIMDRAIGRLNVLEYLILLLALALALLGGALVAWILQTAFGISFRLGWAGASLLLFLIPGISVYVRERRRSGRRSGVVPGSAWPVALPPEPGRQPEPQDQKEPHG
jgi:hypothetical protein